MPQAHTVLDTDFAAGSHFNAHVRAWQAHSDPGLLHYVGLLESQRLPAPLQNMLQTHRGILEPGFHRFHLHQARVSLTVCVGEMDGVLDELRMQADAVFAPSTAAGWNAWTAKRLARHCRRHASLHISGPIDAAQQLALKACGFMATAGQDEIWHFNPHWHLKRLPDQSAPPEASADDRHCAVIGAGLAGASVAYALAWRGWQVTVLERNAHAAGGASGLPAGLAVPQISSDDNARSRLCRAGIALLQQHARHLLHAGTDWAATGVLSLQAGSGTWHPQGCWVRPARLVEAWLSHPNIALRCARTAGRIDFHEGHWRVLDATGQSIVQARHVMLANAGAVRNLGLPGNPATDDFARLTELRGVVNSGVWPDGTADAARSPFPVNGDGSFIPATPGPAGDQWHCGASFESGEATSDEIARGSAANRARLSRLLPASARTLAAQWQHPQLQAWRGVRCATHDRLPLVGALGTTTQQVPTGLWCSIGLGARGLSLAALCAEQLAAEMNDEPWPMEAQLRKSLRVGRSRPPTPW